MTSSSDRSLTFIEDFAKMDKGLGRLVGFTPHYVFWECPGCDQSYIENDCFGGGKYCAVEPSNTAIKGQEIVLEDLRQACLWEIMLAEDNTAPWWDYVSEVHKECYSVINADCSKRAHEKLSLDWKKTQKCVTKSFSTPNKKDWAKASTTNSIIDEEISYWKEFGTNVYPSIVINKKTYRGQIEPLAVFNALCAAFKDPPTQCYKTLHRDA